MRHIPYFNFVCDPQAPVVSCPQPGRFHRFEFMLMPGQTKEHMEDPATVRALIGRYVDPDKFEVKRRLVYTFNALVAKEWRKGRVFLAGDAAHMTPQFMGQGMSSGVRDAYNLAWKLEAVLSGKASDKLLDTYGSERYHHAKSMIDISVLMKDFVSMANPVASALRNLTVKVLEATPVAGKWLREGGFKPTPTYKNGSYLGLPRKRRKGVEGTPIPQPQVRTFKGKRVLLDEVLGEGYALIGLENNPRECLSADSLGLLDALESRFVTLFPFGGRPQGLHEQRQTPERVVEVEDTDGELIKWFRRGGRMRQPVAIVRPDKFVFGLVEAEALDEALSELRSQLGWRPDLAGRNNGATALRKSA
ncbi:3-(3-hydroxy-phenyl)propionate/3-hydroxycinnamic acid hydroxylase [compost metagenome]